MTTTTRRRPPEFPRYHPSPEPSTDPETPATSPLFSKLKPSGGARRGPAGGGLSESPCGGSCRWRKKRTGAEKGGDSNPPAQAQFYGSEKGPIRVIFMGRFIEPMGRSAPCPHLSLHTGYAYVRRLASRVRRAPPLGDSEGDYPAIPSPVALLRSFAVDSWWLGPEARSLSRGSFQLGRKASLGRGGSCPGAATFPSVARFQGRR
nr:unnamed protein product [Digitaria exilis]